MGMAIPKFENRIITLQNTLQGHPQKKKRTLCKTASTIMNKLTLCCFTRPETYCLSTKRNYQIFYEKPGKTYLLVKKMQFNGVEKSNKPLFALSQQDFTWSEHLELSTRN